MKLGAHLGIASGLRRTAREAVRLRCECVQVFVSNPRAWRRGPDPAPDDIAALREIFERRGIGPLICHAAYLVNLASPQEGLWRKSLQTALADLERVRLLGADRYVVSAGSHRGGTRQVGRERLAQGLRELAAAAGGVLVLIENTAGAGSALCWRLEEVAQVLAAAGDAPALGLCLDTCHAHVAGYDLSAPPSVAAALERLERVVGLVRVGAVHLNDARFPAGSRRDAHAHIGRGTIGSAGLRAVVGDARLEHTPGVIETPKDHDADRRNLRLLRRLRTEAQRSPGR